MNLSHLVLCLSLCTPQIVQAAGPFISEITEIEETNNQREELQNERQFEQGRLAFFFGDYKLAKNLWKPLLEQQHPKVLSATAWMYHTGTGYKKDLAKAIELYKQAAQQNQVTALNNLGALFEQGKGVTKSEKNALELYLKAAVQNYGIAQYNYAKLLKKTNRGQSSEIIKWYGRAAELGVGDSREIVLEWNRKNIQHEKEKATLSSLSKLTDRARLKNIPEENFTINITSTNKKSELNKLINYLDLPEEFIQFNTGYHGDEWFTLLYGNFSSEKEAKKILATLPSSLRKGTAYVRSIKQIKTILKQRNK